MHRILKTIPHSLTWCQRVFMQHIFRRKSEVEGFELDTLRHLFGKNNKKNDQLLPRARRKRDPDRPGKTHLCLSVVNPGGSSGTKSLLLEVHSSSLKKLPYFYLFNCGESTDRIMMYQQTGIYRRTECLSNLRNIFITDVSWPNIGGVMGVLLSAVSLCSAVEYKFTLHGPPGVKDVSDSGKTRYAYSGLPQDLSSIANIDVMSPESGPFVDKYIHVQYVTLRKDKSAISTERSGGQETHGQDDDMVMAYIVKPKPSRSWNFQRIFSMGLRPGPWMFDVLDNRSEVEVDNIKVKTEDIVKVETSLTFVVLECPTVSYLTSLLAATELRELSEDDGACKCVVHMSPLEVVNHPDYQAFMKRFGNATQHLMLNENSVAPAYCGSLAFHQVLHHLNPDIFPKLPILDKLLADRDFTRDVDGSSSVLQGQHQMAYWLKSSTQLGLDWTKKPVLGQKHYFSDAVKQEIATLRHNLAQFKENKEDHRKYPEVVFLGTASSNPQRVRNITSILIHTSCDSCLLFDCGEGTLNQLICLYGDDLDDVLCRLKAMFISHMHYDHIAGILSVAARRKVALEQRGLPVTKLRVLCPYSIMQGYINSQMAMFPDVWDYIQLMGNNKFTVVPRAVYNRSVENDGTELYKDLHLEKVIINKMRHKDAKQSWGFILYGLGGWKVAFSGDTMPCQVFAGAARHCDLLIHEATYDDTFQKRAYYNKHSTTSEAIEIGRLAEAKFTILTHFSAMFQYNIMPIELREFPPNVAFAYDFMRVSLGDLPSVRMTEPVLNMIYMNNVFRTEGVFRENNDTVLEKRLNEISQNIPQH